MTKRYYEYLPAGLCPRANRDSQKELKFESIDSGYAIGTAGAKGTGRSQTVQLLHGSEVAHWPNAAEHAQGLFQAVGDQDNTEIILESTANGIGNFFHQSWVSAEQGSSEFQAIFVPWYWQPEYKAFYTQNHDEMKKNISEIYDQIEQLGKDLADSINQDGTPPHKWNALRNFAKFIPPLLRTRSQKQPETQPMPVVELPVVEQPEMEEKDGTRGVLANTKKGRKNANNSN